MTSPRRSFRPAVDSLDPRILLSSTPSGFSPAQMKVAYNENFTFTVGNKSYLADGTNQTIAIVIGGLDPNIINDLHTFDRQFGLQNPDIKTFAFAGAQNNESVLNQVETAMDVEWAHAMAPGANIMLVQATSMNSADLVTAVDWARKQPGVSVVSMSWGRQESSADMTSNYAFTTPAGHNGVTFVASAGDLGAWTNPQETQVGVQWPASDPTVLSVGGTTLGVYASGAYQGETAWSGGGGGYSKVYAEPSYQRGVQNTGFRTVPDVSYDADPNSGVSVYNTSSGGWIKEGGTSAGAPQWAGLVAVANEGRALVGLGTLDGVSQTIPTLYRYSSDFHDIVYGSNGFAATRGYDVATGLGTPIAISIVSDLAFKTVTSNVTFSTTAMSAGLSAAGSSTQPHAVVVAAASAQNGDVTTTTARIDSQDSLTEARHIGSPTVTRDSIVVAVSLEALAGHSTTRHLGLFDSALESLLSEKALAQAI